MKETTKNYLGVAIIISILIVAFSSWSFVRSYSRSIEPSSFRSFSVSGEGEVVAVPDVAQFSFSVITEGGTDIAGLQEKNVEKTNAAIDFVKSRGVDGKDIKTQNYNLNPRYQYYSCPRSLGEEVEPCPPPEIVGYSINQTVLVKVRDFAKIGDVLGGVVSAGANGVSQLNFTIDDPEEVRAEAREQAIDEAKEKAKSIAKAAGFNLGRILSISESGIGTPYPVYASRAESFGLGGADGATAPKIEPGSEDVTVTVTLTYEIR